MDGATITEERGRVDAPGGHRLQDVAVPAARRGGPMERNVVTVDGHIMMATTSAPLFRHTCTQALLSA
eukprot:scaffold40051_cov23-Prasinocladus_malaysianus.AAC.7